MKMTTFLGFLVVVIWFPVSLAAGYGERDISTIMDEVFSQSNVGYVDEGIDQVVGRSFIPDNQSGTSTPIPTSSPTVEPTPTPIVGGPVGENVSLVCGAIILLLIINL